MLRTILQEYRRNRAANRDWQPAEAEGVYPAAAVESAGTSS